MEPETSQSDAEKRKKRDKIIVLLPAYNEEGKIGQVVTRIKKSRILNFPISIQVISDGSTDRTADEARRAGAMVLEKKRNRGVGAALRTGFDYARKQGFEIAIVMAGDNQDNPDEIPAVLDPIIHDDYDFIQGSRRLHRRQTVNIPLFRRITTRIYSLIFSLLTGRRITDGTNGFRALKLTMLDDPRINLNQDWLDTYELEPYLYYQAMALGYRVKEVQVTKTYHKAVIGYSKMIPFVDWWRIIKPILLLSLGIRK